MWDLLDVDRLVHVSALLDVRSVWLQTTRPSLGVEGALLHSHGFSRCLDVRKTDVEP